MADWPLTCCNSVIKQSMIKPYYHARKKNIQKHTKYVSVSQGDIHTKFTWQKFNKNILETDLLNLSTPEKSVVSAGSVQDSSSEKQEGALLSLSFSFIFFFCRCSLFFW